MELTFLQLNFPAVCSPQPEKEMGQVWIMALGNSADIQVKDNVTWSEGLQFDNWGVSSPNSFTGGLYSGTQKLESIPNPIQLAYASRFKRKHHP